MSRLEHPTTGRVTPTNHKAGTHRPIALDDLPLDLPYEPEKDQLVKIVDMLVITQHLVEKRVLVPYEKDGEQITPKTIIANIVLSKAFREADGCRVYVPGYPQSLSLKNDPRFSVYGLQDAYVYYLGAARGSSLSPSDANIGLSSLISLWMDVSDYLSDRGAATKSFLIETRHRAESYVPEAEVALARQTQLLSTHRYELACETLMLEMLRLFLSFVGKRVTKAEVFDQLGHIGDIEFTMTERERAYRYLVDNGILSFDSQRHPSPGHIDASTFDFSRVALAINPKARLDDSEEETKLRELVQPFVKDSIDALVKNCNLKIDEEADVVSQETSTTIVPIQAAAPMSLSDEEPSALTYEDLFEVAAHAADSFETTPPVNETPVVVEETSHSDWSLEDGPLGDWHFDGIEMESPRSRTGEAYAVLTDDGELVFFRSEEKYEDGETARARDVLGNEYEGVVYSGVETKKWSILDKPGWHNKAVVSVRIADGQAIAPVSCAQWFYGLKNMTSCDLAWLDTSKVKDMTGMFQECESLVAPPDTSRWDTSMVEDMSWMFYNCHSLVNPPETSGWDTSNVADMMYMFSGCESMVEPPDTSRWDTCKVENMSSMFKTCKSMIEPPDTNGWDTSKVEDMSSMFKACKSMIEPPDTSGWDTSNVTDMDRMFYECHSLVNPPDTSKWDISRVEDMCWMFYSCESLKVLPKMQGWDILPRSKRDFMFSGCSSLSPQDRAKVKW